MQGPTSASSPGSVRVRWPSTHRGMCVHIPIKTQHVFSPGFLLLSTGPNILHWYHALDIAVKP
ncbi:hypothetical protein NKDENANG_02696 [Candidatus Entotheonellaceae bacterium PAL068K]